MSFDFDFEDDGLSLNDIPEPVFADRIKISKIHCYRFDPDDPSASKFVNKMISLKARLNSFASDEGRFTLTDGARNNLILSEDFTSLLSGCLAEYNVFQMKRGYSNDYPSYPPFTGIQEKYIVPPSIRIDIGKPLLVFRTGNCLREYYWLSTHGDGYSFHGIYRYQTTDIFGRTHWQRVSRSITICKVGNGNDRKGEYMFLNEEENGNSCQSL